MLYEADEPIAYVHFPLIGRVSIVVALAGDTPVEVATVGNEGMIGVPVFLGATSASMRAFTQIPGVTARMKAARFKRLIESGGRLREMVQRYTQVS